LDVCKRSGKRKEKKSKTETDKNKYKVPLNVREITRISVLLEAQNPPSVNVHTPPTKRALSNECFLSFLYAKGGN
jgi:hypothetical protein